MSAYDPCVFTNDSNGLILEVHVDDINVMGRDINAILDFKAQISRTFPMTDEGECSWYLGMHVEQKPGEIRIHQKQYIDQIVAKYGFSQAAPVKTPLEKDIKLIKQGDYNAHPKFRTVYQSKVGSLNFASNQTRPDISFATGYVARYASNPNQKHMDAVDHIFAYLKNDPGKGIVYSGKHGLHLTGFVDSDFAGCEDSRRSTTGWVFTLAGGPVSWSSQRQKTVATSTMDAEYIAGAEAAKEAVWIRNFINDLRIPGVHIDTVPLYIDSNSALKLTRNPEFHSRSKHIDVKHHFIREKVDEGIINTQRVDTKDNLADAFTKALPKTTHEGRNATEETAWQAVSGVRQ
ncbi:retrovirus-related pol polyprotein [Purpureocillium lilacinum]|uniref:Retrovirus-related pol polyprotein n=1 Tax=Purpureocillium lilacinum TaxID=33203 RepID=A0A179F7B1_PURLI|nr:retrovirus-related pol polyprotein [Purpureocillium lilacinum]OAQ61354.1 retrovirus-related pol polyprotein [Purpureocillium lilacinum]